MIRQIRLYNSKNDMIDFLNNLDFFGFSPEGLGVSFDNDLYGSNATFLSGGKALNAKQFTINILFGAETGESYQRYSEFVQFLNKPPYRLYYETDAGTFYRDCLLSELTKTELNEYSVLQESFVLDFTTPFYRWISESYEPTPDTVGDGKIYFDDTSGEHYYTYPYVYESDYNGKNGVFTIKNESVYIGSSIGSPVEITIYGPCVNPYWEVLLGSTVDQSDGFNLTVAEGYRLVVSSVPTEQRAKLIAPDGTVSNVYQQQDLARSNFVTLPEGQSRLIFHNVSTVKFRYREEWVTV